MATVLRRAARNMDGSDHPCGDLLCAMKSESVEETLTAMRQYVGERVRSNEGDAEVVAACTIWEAVGENGGAHRMASAEGLVYVARAGNMAGKEAAAGALQRASMRTATVRATQATARTVHPTAAPMAAKRPLTQCATR